MPWQKYALYNWCPSSFLYDTEDANIFQCAGAALTTAVSQLQRNVTELKTCTVLRAGVTELTTYSGQNSTTGNLSKMISILI